VEATVRSKDNRNRTRSRDLALAGDDLDRFAALRLLLDA
jgi:hypothetical protein